MDNFHFDITSKGSLIEPMKMILGSAKVQGYAIREAREEAHYDSDWEELKKVRIYKHMIIPIRDPSPRRLVFYWSMTNITDAHPLPFKMDAEGAANFAMSWLAYQPKEVYDDADVETGRGWRLWNEAWGHVDSQWQAIAAVAPVAALYGK